MYYNTEKITLLDKKPDKTATFYLTNEKEKVFHTLKEKFQELEEKKIKNNQKNKNKGINEDEKSTIEGIKREILEEICNNPGIFGTKLEEKFKKKISSATLERKLKELSNLNLIEYRGSKKTGGYFVF